MSDDNGTRAADAVIAELEARIISGRLQDRHPLPSERDLMKEFKSSRTVVREAIAALSNRGLVESRPRFRPVVRAPNFGTIVDTTDTIVRHLLNNERGVRQLYESRIFVERGLVRDAALSATKSDIAALKAALKKNKNAIGDSLEFFQTDMAFHRALYDTANNPVFPAIHKAYTAWLSPHCEEMEWGIDRNEQNYRAHELIYNAILERDADAAEKALIDHLNQAWEFVRSTFESNGFDKGY